MADFPTDTGSDFPAPIRAGYGYNTTLGDMMQIGNYTGGPAVWPSANRAIYQAFYIQTPFQVKLIQIDVTTQSGNLDVGVYDEKGNRIVTKGSTAVAAAGQQTFDMTTSVTGTASPVLGTGTYWLAMCVDNTTAAFQRSAAVTASLTVNGVQQQANGSVTLPSAATFANPASAYIPFIVCKGLTTA